jgi:hypothetical protein
VRHRHPSGKLESSDAFAARRFCDRACIGRARTADYEDRLDEDFVVTPAMRAYLKAFDRYVRAWAADDIDGMLDAQRERERRLNDLTQPD